MHYSYVETLLTFEACTTHFAETLLTIKTCTIHYLLGTKQRSDESINMLYFTK